MLTNEAPHLRNAINFSFTATNRTDKRMSRIGRSYCIGPRRRNFK